MNKTNEWNELLGEMTPEKKEALAEAKQRLLKKEARKKSSLWHFVIPDWTGQGGTVSIWANNDGSFESDDSRIGDKEIREGIKIFARDWA